MNGHVVLHRLCIRMNLDDDDPVTLCGHVDVESQDSRFSFLYTATEILTVHTGSLGSAWRDL
ncbi:hypothetical protein [Kribbella ginsengisoli]|uniref:hypothetical protein n=1 Tax=Kribbella ginsengisoli TaxID=363865 RepID=UPI0031D24593